MFIKFNQPISPDTVRIVVQVFDRSAILVATIRIPAVRKATGFKFSGPAGHYSYQLEAFNYQGNSIKLPFVDFEVSAAEEVKVVESDVVLDEGSDNKIEPVVAPIVTTTQEPVTTPEPDEIKKVVEDKSGRDIDVRVKLNRKIGLSQRQIDILAKNDLHTVEDVRNFVKKHGDLVPAVNIGVKLSDAILKVLNIKPSKN